MKPWAKRTREEAHLLNPPFCCVNIASACAGYRKSSNIPLPFGLVFMVLPIVLHKHTRESLPRNISTSIPAWLQEYADARIGFYERLMALQPHSREAIRYGLSYGWLSIGDTGGIRCVVKDTQIDRAIRSLDGDAQHCVSRSRFLGRWFATASSETIMTLWGIRP